MRTRLGVLAIALLFAGVLLWFLLPGGTTRADTIAPTADPPPTHGPRGRSSVSRGEVQAPKPASPRQDRVVDVPPAQAEDVGVREASVSAESAKQSVWPPTKEGIDGAMREVLHDIRRCYQLALEEFPDLEGSFVAEFVITDEDGLGVVTAASVLRASTIEDEPMEDCVFDVLHSLAFDPPEDGGSMTVTYPFKFSPG